MPPGADHRQEGIAAHRRSTLAHSDITRCGNIPLTTPIRTLIDLAPRITRNELEAAINEADKLDLVDPEGLRAALDERKGQQGVGVLRRVLDRSTFRLTDSELELSSLRFSHAQIRFEPEGVQRTLIAVARRLSTASGG